MRRFLAMGVAAALAVGGSAACATKKYVRTTVDDVSGRVTSLTEAVEATQEQTRKNDARITQVDTAMQSVRQVAQQATQTAKEASSLAQALDANIEKIEEMERLSRKVEYEVVLSDDAVTFEFGETGLSDAAKGQLQALVEKLKQDPRNVFIAIEGHTDNAGSRLVNERIGLERAESVERYLYEEHRIPLPKMDVISYGEDDPVAPNTTRAGRAQNRRVVIKVMA